MRNAITKIQIDIMETKSQLLFMTSTRICRHGTLTTLLIFLASCTTIEISESDVFDNHRTIIPDYFENSNFTLQEHFIESGDEEIHLWYLERAGAGATVVYFGGNGFLIVKARNLVESYEHIPVNLVLFDYRGYGLSSGSPNVAGIKQDAESVVNFVHQNYETEFSEMILHGHSMGSFNSAWLAGVVNPAGYILESPVSSVESWTSGIVPFLLRPFIRIRVDDTIKAENNLKRVAENSMPLLIITGDEDEITPVRMSEELYKASASDSKKLVILEGGGHNDLPDFDLYPETINTFLDGIFAETTPQAE